MGGGSDSDAEALRIQLAETEVCVLINQSLSLFIKGAVLVALVLHDFLLIDRQYSMLVKLNISAC